MGGQAGRQADRLRHTDMTKLILTFRNFANSHKNNVVHQQKIPKISV
jgi:hypothetical protein